MVPVYAASSFLQMYYYTHAIYFQVMSDCYEAFAIASFFALMCHYVAPDLHEQKEYFRNLHPVKPWIWPLSWTAKCCGGQRGPWRTPKSGLTWFNIIWIGIYHYCFIRIAMTLTAVATQHFDRYCESSNSPVFAHIWVAAINCLAVTIAMYSIIQFYVQLKGPLREHRPFLKVLAIKLVVFFSFWQATAISVATSAQLTIVQPNQILAYPDIKVGIPALLLCFEMAIFAILHLWAFPAKPYVPGAPTTYYPCPDERKLNMVPLRENEHVTPQGGPLGIWAFVDAVNIWDYAKAFARGMRWLFCGVKSRRADKSYLARSATVNMDDLTKSGAVPRTDSGDSKGTDHLPIAHEFRRSRFGLPAVPGDPIAMAAADERAGLIEHAAAHPVDRWSHHGAVEPRQAQLGSPTPGGLAPPSPLEPPYSDRSFDYGRRVPTNADDEWAPSERRQVDGHQQYQQYPPPPQQQPQWER